MQHLWRPIYCLLFLGSSIVYSQSSQIESLTEELGQLQGEIYYSKSNDLAKLYLNRDATKALELSERNINSDDISQFPEQLARAKYLKGMALTVSGKYLLAQQAFDESIALSQKLQDKTLLAQSYVGSAIIFTRNAEYDKAKKLYESSILILTDNGNHQALAEAYFRFGKHKFFTGDNETSLDYYNQSLKIYEGLEDKKGVSDVTYWIGVFYEGLNDEEKALQYYFDSRVIKEEIQDIRGLSHSNLSLGAVHWENGNYETAMDYYRQSLAGYSKLGDRSSAARVYNNMGLVYEDWNKLDSALVYHEKSLEVHTELKSTIGLIRSYSNLGETYLLQKDYNRAKANFSKAKWHSEISERQTSLTYIHDKLAEAFIGMKQLDSASIYLDRSLELATEKDDYSVIESIYFHLSRLEKEKGNYKRALEYYELHKKVADSLSRTQKDKELAEIQAKYDTEKQEKEIIGLQQENEKRTLWRNVFAVGTLATLGFALLLFQLFRLRNRKNKARLAAEETQRLELEKLDKMKSRFFGNISHEFRTPLTLILGPLEKIRKNIDNSLQPTVDIIERNGNRLLKLINQLLDLSKIESGRVALKASLIDVVPLLKGWVTSFSSLAETKDIKLDFNAEKDSCFVYIDHEKMEEVIINLLSNAFKYTANGGQIVVAIREKRKNEKEYLGISVSDTGTGIPEQEIEHIFDRFYQASNADAEDVTGTGIGLSLIKELVELHKGTVHVKSAMDKGSTFEVLLPLGREHLDDDKIVGISQAQQVVQEEQLVALVPDVEIAMEAELDENLPIVLMIEDSKDLRGYIRDILKESYHVIEAVNGKEGVVMAIEHIPDIVLSDLMMPKMDGYQVCRTLKEDMRTSHIPVILLTAKSSKEDKIEGLKSLADDYLTKPFDTEELLIRLKNLIDLRRKMQEHFGTGDILRPKKIRMSSMDAVFMENVTDQLETEISNSLFGVVELADAVGLSQSQLLRKVKAITNLTPNEFIRSFRLHRAMEMLQQQTGTVAEIAFDTGFQNASYFAKSFQKQFGKAPSAVKQK